MAHVGRRVAGDDEDLVDACGIEVGERGPRSPEVDVHRPQVRHRGPATVPDAPHGDGGIPGAQREAGQVGDVDGVDPRKGGDLGELRLEGG